LYIIGAQQLYHLLEIFIKICQGSLYNSLNFDGGVKKHLQWARHVFRMGEARNQGKIFGGKLLGGPRKEDIVIHNLTPDPKICEGVNWIILAHSKVHW
jgi:hypothetical protein